MNCALHDSGGVALGVDQVFLTATEVIVDPKKLETILQGATEAAIAYRELTGKPLGITGEIGECLAAKLLGLELASVRTPGYDATDQRGRRIQIKSRSIPKGKRRHGQRLGSIELKYVWDVVLLVLLNERFDPQAIYEAERAAIERLLKEPGSKARNERGAVSVTAFIRIGKPVWLAGQTSVGCGSLGPEADWWSSPGICARGE